ncbi:hypothetical protein N9846_03870 [Akkermansiaceae bacterium]|nr:hypothetical protein [Akkermansiaceae bacterium]
MIRTPASGSSMDSIQATGAQWAIWELVAESAGSYDITIAIDTPFGGRRRQHRCTKISR